MSYDGHLRVAFVEGLMQLKKVALATPIKGAASPTAFEQMLTEAKGVRASDERLVRILRNQQGASERIARLEREDSDLYEALALEAERACIHLAHPPVHHRTAWYRTWKNKANANQKLGHVRILKHLRHGSLSSSTSVGRLPDQTICLVKRYRPLREALSPQEMFAHQERMIQRLRKIQDPRVEEIFDHFLLEDDTYVQIKPYLRCVSLWDWMKQHTERAPRIVLLQEIARVLLLLHDHDIAHMDLKPDQILLFPEQQGGWSSPPKLTLIDYDFSMVDGMLTLSVGSAPYYAPEQFDEARRPRSHKEGKQADVYAFCVMVHRLLSERFPFGDGRTEPTHLDIHKIERDWDALEIPHKPLHDVIRAGIDPEPKHRPKLSEILEVLEDPALLAVSGAFPTERKVVPIARQNLLNRRASSQETNAWVWFWGALGALLAWLIFGRGCT